MWVQWGALLWDGCFQIESFLGAITDFLLQISRCLPDCESAPCSWDPGTCRGTSSHVIPVNTVPEPGVEVREVSLLSAL